MLNIELRDFLRMCATNKFPKRGCPYMGSGLATYPRYKKNPAEAGFKVAEQSNTTTGRCYIKKISLILGP